MQHGSYQLLEVERQPLIASGVVVLYRGIEQAETFRFLRIGSRDAQTESGRVFARYARVQAHVLSDSMRSFNSIHAPSAGDDGDPFVNPDRTWLWLTPGVRVAVYSAGERTEE